MLNMRYKEMFMRLRPSIAHGLQKVKTNSLVAVSTLGLILGAGGLSVAIPASANADSVSTVAGCQFNVSGNTWQLLANCNSTQEINVPSGITLDGAGYTISPAFSFTSNSNNAVLGIDGSAGVTVQNLIIDGTPVGVFGAKLHGINAYVSTGVAINKVTVKNMTKNGLVVNGSDVSVSSVTTSNNGWGGIDVDQGLGVTAPAVLNIVGPMAQSEVVQIFVDDTSKNVAVNDLLHQYSVSNPTPTSALYTRIYATGKDSCKDSGWMLGASAAQSFENQGQCVAYFQSGDKKDKPAPKADEEVKKSDKPAKK